MNKFIAIATCIIVLASLKIISAAYYYSLEEDRLATWKPPAIEQCDKELWERIRMECDE